MSNKQSRDNSKTKEVIYNILSTPHSRIHFIGIGGVSMYSLARLTMTFGMDVSGSDREENERISELTLLGALVNIGHHSDNVNNSALVVYSHAINEDNPEITKAKQLGIPAISRSEYLGAIMQRYHRCIGVSGSHGKSTTVAMLDCIFSYAGANPTTLSGADLPIGEPVRIGGGGTLIYEACEYKDSFLDFIPWVSVALNLELDHTDYFADLEAIKTSFSKALNRAEGFAVINGDDPNLLDIRDSVKCRKLTFGGSPNNDYRYSITAFNEVGFDFTISRHDSVIGSFTINIPGAFNVSNAVAAIVTALEYGFTAGEIAEAISSFRGIPRRLEYIGSRFGRPAFYDYAHHPTEIRESINTLRLLTGRRLAVVFKPHTFSRTRDLWREFVNSLSMAESVILTDIFPAREQPIEGITSSALAEQIGSNAIFLSEDKIIEYLDLHTDGAIVLMGAGNLEKIKQGIINDI